MNTLDQALNGEIEEEAVEPVEVEQTTEVTAEAEAEPTVETEETQETAPTAEEVKPSEPTELELVQRQLNAAIAKANDEKSKRQALQQQLQPKEEAPDPYVEPDKAIEFAQQQAISQSDARFLNYAFENAKDKWDDFLEMQDVFFDEMAVNNPSLVQQAQQMPDPYKFIYNQAKTHSEFKGIGSVDDLRSKIETEVRAKLELEYAEKQKQAAEAAITNSIPGTLSKATAAGGATKETWSGPASLDQILGH